MTLLLVISLFSPKPLIPQPVGRRDVSRNWTTGAEMGFATALFLGLLVGLVPGARAATIGLDAFSGSETLIDFTGLDVPRTSNPITVGDLTMDSSVSELTIPAMDTFGVWAETPLASGGEYLSNWTTSSTNMEIQFANPVSRVGMWINGGNRATNWTFSAFDSAGSLVGSHVFVYSLLNGYPDPSVFAGVEFDTRFTNLMIVETANNRQFTNIDDIRFEAVPEPSTAILLAIGLAGIGIRGRHCRDPRP
jgi:hypothetical protein